jgi:hypothetical protein
LREVAEDFYNDLVMILDTNTKIYSGTKQDLASTQSLYRVKWQREQSELDPLSHDRIAEVLNYDVRAKRTQQATLVQNR